jgi:hypothetical protein
MRNVLLSFFVLALFACNSAGFEGDERQIIAKDIIRKQIPQNHSFDVVAFKQDTVFNWPDITIKHPLAYTLDFAYLDSTATLISKRGIVIFSPTGNTVLSSSIQDR